MHDMLLPRAVILWCTKHTSALNILTSLAVYQSENALEQKEGWRETRKLSGRQETASDGFSAQRTALRL